VIFTDDGSITKCPDIAEKGVFESGRMLSPVNSLLILQGSFVLLPPEHIVS
jgi:hypothetical protein